MTAETRPDVTAAPAALRARTSTNRRLLSWSAFTVGVRVGGRLSQLAFLVLAAHTISIGEFASYSYLVALATTFVVLADTGVALVASRAIAAGSMAPGEAFWSSLPVVALGAALASGLVAGFGLLDRGPGASGLPLACIVIFVAANTILNAAMTLLRGLGRFGADAWLQAAQALALIIPGSALLLAGTDVQALMLLLAGKEVVLCAVALAILGPSVRPRVAWTWKRTRGLMTAGITLAIATAALTVMTRAQLVVVANGAGERDVAWLSAALRVSDAAFTLAATVGFALLPGLVVIWREDAARARRLLGRVMAVALAAGAVASVGGALFANSGMTLVFGDSFDGSGEIAQPIFAATVACVALGIAWHGLISLHAERDVMTLAAVGAVLALALALAGQAVAATEGVAWSYAVTFAIVAAAAAARLRTRMREAA